jgi:hypothetical protein
MFQKAAVIVVAAFLPAAAYAAARSLDVSPTMLDSAHERAEMGPLMDLAQLIQRFVRKGYVTRDLSKLFCPFCDFSKLDLRGVDFTGANLYRANFTDSILSKATFRNALIAGGIFLRTNLEGANLSQDIQTSLDALVAEPIKRGAVQSAAPKTPNFDCAQLKGADLSGRTLATVFRERRNKAVGFQAARFAQADLENAVLYPVGLLYSSDDDWEQDPTQELMMSAFGNDQATTVFVPATSNKTAFVYVAVGINDQASVSDHFDRMGLSALAGELKQAKHFETAKVPQLIRELSRGPSVNRSVKCSPR